MIDGSADQKRLSRTIVSVGDKEKMTEEEHFEQMYEAGDTPWDIGKPDFNLVQTVATTPIEPCKALEMGCGTGDNSIWLSQQTFHVVGIDISEIAIEKAREKAANANVKCTFLVLDILTTQVDGAPFGFAFDRGFLHTLGSDEVRKSFAKKVSGYLEDGGLWLSLLGNVDEERGDRPGPPQRSARDIVNAVEPYFEILSLTSSYFETKLPHPPRAWVCLMRKRR